MTSAEVVRNLEQLKGQEFDKESVICAFEDFEEYGETSVIVSETSDERNFQNGDNVITCKIYNAYIDVEESTIFAIAVSKADNKVVDVWED